MPADGGKRPTVNSVLHGRVGRVPDRNLACNLHATQNVGVLAVTVGSLVQVHEVHVDG